MYFSPEIQERILGNFHFALRPGGVLVGKAEALQKGRKLFEPFDLKRRIFVKDGSVEPGFRLPRLAFGHEAPRADEGDLGEVASEHAPVAQIVLDSDLGIASINQTARVLFALKLGDVGRRLQDLEVSYRPIELSSLIADARSERKGVASRNVEWRGARGGKRFLEVQVTPLLRADRVSGFSVAFTDITTHRALEADLERARRELETASRRAARGPQPPRPGRRLHGSVRPAAQRRRGRRDHRGDPHVDDAPTLRRFTPAPGGKRASWSSRHTKLNLRKSRSVPGC